MIALIGALVVSGLAVTKLANSTTGVKDISTPKRIKSMAQPYIPQPNSYVNVATIPRYESDSRRNDDQPIQCSQPIYVNQPPPVIHVQPPIIINDGYLNNGESRRNSGSPNNYYNYNNYNDCQYTPRNTYTPLNTNVCTDPSSRRYDSSPNRNGSYGYSDIIFDTTPQLSTPITKPYKPIFNYDVINEYGF